MRSDEIEDTPYLEGTLTKLQIYLFCLENGMLSSHATPVLKKLKNDRVIECAFT